MLRKLLKSEYLYASNGTVTCHIFLIGNTPICIKEIKKLYSVYIPNSTSRNFFVWKNNQRYTQLLINKDTKLRVMDKEKRDENSL